MRQGSKIILVLAIMLTASTSFASLVDGNATGKFVNPDLQPHAWFAGTDTDFFEFGKSHLDHYGNPIYGHSSLKFTGRDFRLDNADNKFVIGDLKFVNATSLVGTSINAIDLMVNVDFSSLVDEVITFGLDLNQTINTGNNDDDTVDLPAAYTATNTFLIDGVEYIFMAMFGTLENGVFTETDFLQAPEQGMASTQLVGMFTAVPLPAAVWVFGAGLFGLLGFSRKRA